MLLLWLKINAVVLPTGQPTVKSLSHSFSYCQQYLMICIVLMHGRTPVVRQFLSWFLTGGTCSCDPVSVGTNAQQLHGDRSLGQENVGSE